MPVTFRTGWCATDLGDIRPCDGTYGWYAYEDQPSLDDRDFTGAFQWYGDDRGPVDPAAVDRLAALDRRLAADGLSLPADFVTFYRHATLGSALDEVSVTACWTDLSTTPLVSPVEPDARLVRFLRDQQDCVIWYLYLRPGGESFVVFADTDFEDLAEEEDGDEDVESWEPEIVWCSPSFEQFAYRFWVENRAWAGLHEWEGAQLDEATRAYLSRFPGANAVLSDTSTG